MGWTFREAGPEGAARTVLLLPGAWCTSAFYDELLAAPELDERGVRLVAATPPGFGGNPAPEGFDWTVEGYARLLREKVEALRPDVVAAHSYCANVAIEMAIDGYAERPLVLLSPAFSYEDEEREVKLLDRIGRIPGVGWLAWAAFPLTIAPGMRGRFPEDRRKFLAGEMKRTPSQMNRILVRRYTEYLQQNGPLAEAFVATGATATVVFGDQDEVGLQDAERAALEAAPNVELLTFEDAHHFLMLDQPQRTLETILAALPA